MLTITALLENKTINPALTHYAGLSLLLDDGDKRVLFDTGKDLAFLTNAEKLNIDIASIETIVISHGHYDHFGGLTKLDASYFNQRPTVVAHPHIFSHRKSALFFGSKSLLFKRLNPLFDRKALEAQFTFHLTTEPYRLSDRLIYSGEVPNRQVNKRYGVILGENNQTDDYVLDDYVLDDSFLVWQGNNGLVIITGCSHSGIESIIQRAKEITGNQQIQAVIGGLHLRLASKAALDRAKKAIEPDMQIYGCHCTGERGRAYLNAKDFNAGQSLQFE